MGFLSDSQNALIRQAVVTPSLTGESLADLYRSPAEASSKTAARVLTQSGIPIRLRPAGQGTNNYIMRVMPQPVSAARASQLGKVALGTDVRYGDELRVGSARYLVDGIGQWGNAIMLALVEVKVQA